MQVNFLLSVQSIAFKPNAALLCALLLSACNSKVIEPMRVVTVTAPSQAATRLANDLAAPKTASYGVPDASSVSFTTNAPDQVVDLTY
jgi:hypothetical protein